jgi:hypothetical protein
MALGASRTSIMPIDDILHRENIEIWCKKEFVFGGIGVGFIADLSSNSIAIRLVAWIAITSSVFVFLIMKEARKQSKIS